MLTHCQIYRLQYRFRRVQLQEEHDEDAVIWELVKVCAHTLDIVDQNAAYETQHLTHKTELLINSGTHDRQSVIGNGHTL